MSRQLVFELDTIQTSPVRRPKWKIEVYDIRSTADTIGDIVRGLTLDSQTGPRDFTADTVSIAITEKVGTFVDGPASSSIQVQVADPNRLFDPFNTIGNPSGDGRWLRRGNVVRIYEGDDRIDEGDWPITFTGKISGQAGTLTSRVANANPNILAFEALGREADFLKFKNVSQNFPIATSYLSMGNTIATIDMGLDADEIDFVGWGATTAAQPVQFLEEPPLVSLARLMFVDGFVPRFDGEGKLTQSLALLTGIPARIYEDDGPVVSMDRPFSKIDPPNSIVLKGLDSTMSKVVQPSQVIATLNLTTGYFTQDESLNVYWSEDRSILAQNVSVNTRRSVNGGLSILGADEDFTLIPSDAGLEGSIGMRVDFTTGFAPRLLIFLMIEYVALAAIPDEVVTAVVGGITIPIGRIAQAIQLAIMLLIMTKIGRGDYEFVGEPFEYVYAEITSRAELDGLNSWEVNELIIENHLVNTQATLDALARDILFEQQAQGSPRTFTNIQDLRLEPNDVFDVLTGRSFQVKSLARTLVRTATGNEALSKIQAFEITPGLQP